MPVRISFCALILLSSFASTASADIVSTFEDLGLPANSFNNNAGPGGAFNSAGNALNNTFDPNFGGIWSGWAISSKTDSTTAGFSNQYSAITGSGSGENSSSGTSQTYAVGFTFGGNTDPFHPASSYINLVNGTNPVSIDVTNTTYDYFSMLNGDAFGKKFGPGDFLKLTINGFDGLNGVGKSTGEVDVLLANGTAILKNWDRVDLSLLAGSKSLQFGLVSSDNNPSFGINTPAYFAADNFHVAISSVPEPMSALLLAAGLAGLAGYRWRMKSSAARSLIAGFLFILLFIQGNVQAAYDPQIGQPGSLGIDKTSPVFQEWASSVNSFNRGPQDISNPSSPLANFGVASNALGDTSSLVSLGDGGSITLGFDKPITNGAGNDFAVFENGFLSGAPGSGLAYLELAFVEVTSDGVHYFQFPAVSLTQTSTQVGSFALLDATNLHDLAGKYIGGFGTGFDLSELAGVSPLLDVNHITGVRITDVVGSINPLYGTRDSLGNLVNDPFSTPFASSGFDLNGVGVIHISAVPEPSSAVLALGGLGIMGYLGRRRRILLTRPQPIGK